MDRERHKRLKVGTKIGALAGGILYVVFGLKASFYFGSFGTLALLSHLLGAPVEPGLITRAVVVVGTLLALFCAAAASIVVGSVVGTSLAFVAESITGVSRAKPAVSGAESSTRSE